jgi:hypothetical protein
VEGSCHSEFESLSQDWRVGTETENENPQAGELKLCKNEAGMSIKAHNLSLKKTRVRFRRILVSQAELDLKF